MALQSLLLRPNSKIWLLFLLLSVVLTCVYFRTLLQLTSVTAALPLTWLSSPDFFISQERDNFDVTFANYSVDQQSSLPAYPDLIPPVLHQISLGSGGPKAAWLDARSNCLKHHVDWETHLWTDKNANAFVAKKFPHLKKMWEGYRYPIQKVDALRYMVLYEYGGAVLDMDLDCRRSLGPLRRFGFVAPAAHPAGFSNGMMMARKRHPFVKDLVHNLPRFNVNWLGLPYTTVMFSTGCHYASVIHTLQKKRSDLRILTGPKESPSMHRLNGNVVTPLFHHLGSSSWHSFDAALIVSLGRIDRSIWVRGVGLVTFVCALGVGVWVSLLRRRLTRRRASSLERSRSPEAASFDGPEESFKRA